MPPPPLQNEDAEKDAEKDDKEKLLTPKKEKEDEAQAENSNDEDSKEELSLSSDNEADAGWIEGKSESFIIPFSCFRPFNTLDFPLEISIQTGSSVKRFKFISEFRLQTCFRLVQFPTPTSKRKFHRFPVPSS